MTLYLQRYGTGSDLVLIHGWGWHGGIWQPVVDRLKEGFRVTVVDLPGHGLSEAKPSEFSMTHLVQSVSAVVPEGAVWVGWSLGGMVALAAAADGAAVSRLVLTGSSLRFVSAPDWSDAMPPEILAGFASDLAQDYRGTLKRFLSLQTRGSVGSRELLRKLRSQLCARGEPNVQALEGGLAVLRDTDLRSHASRIHAPVLLIHGQRDALVPLSAAQATARQLPHARLVTIPGAAHAPFLSHPGAFAEALLEFLHG